MKAQHLFHCTGLALLLSTINYPLSTSAQGSLTPPGAPAPTMKSLDQIEARTPISSAPFTITQPGSYFLTTNLTVASGNAITIATNGVGYSSTGTGLSADVAENCEGQSGVNSTGGGDYAIIALNCYGFSIDNGFGVYVVGSAQNCYGYSYSGTALNAINTAIGCYGYSHSGTGLIASIANSCVGQTTAGIAQNIANKYNMP
jgi:hypothetical protein